MDYDFDVGNMAKTLNKEFLFEYLKNVEKISETTSQIEKDLKQLDDDYKKTQQTTSARLISSNPADIAVT
jgi:uncharacterized protein YdaL